MRVSARPEREIVWGYELPTVGATIAIAVQWQTFCSGQRRGDADQKAFDGIKPKLSVVARKNSAGLT